LHLRIHGDPRSGSAFWEAPDREVREPENCGQMLTRLLKYPELELSHNLAETSMRSVALGRKNWIHVGSPQAGRKLAAIFSVVETCRN